MTREQILDLLKSIRRRALEDDPWLPGLILDLVDAIVVSLEPPAPDYQR